MTKILTTALLILTWLSCTAQDKCRPDWDQTDAITNERSFGYQCSMPANRTLFKVGYESSKGYRIYIRHFLREKSSLKTNDTLIVKLANGELLKFSSVGGDDAGNQENLRLSYESEFPVTRTDLEIMSTEGISAFRVQAGLQAKTFELDYQEIDRFKIKQVCLLQLTEQRGF